MRVEHQLLERSQLLMVSWFAGHAQQFGVRLEESEEKCMSSTGSRGWIRTVGSFLPAVFFGSIALVFTVLAMSQSYHFGLSLGVSEGGSLSMARWLSLIDLCTAALPIAAIAMLHRGYRWCAGGLFVVTLVYMAFSMTNQIGFAAAERLTRSEKIRDLPPFNVQALQRLLDKAAPQNVTPGARPHMGLRDGSRKLWLNDLLCSHAMHCDTERELLDVARTANMDLPGSGHAMLEDAVVVERTAVVWRDAQEGKLKAWRGRSGNARACGSELDELCMLSQRNGPDAFALLIRLRLAHSAACRRGETFCITPKAMATAGVIPGWTRERYETARYLLLLSGLVEKVADLKVTRKGRIGAQYRLVDCR
jgi:hypothetical protein